MTFDPYNNRIPWGLLTEEEREPFRKADANIVKYYDNSRWHTKGGPLMLQVDSIVYRLAPPRIDYCFDLFDDKFEWAATQENGTVFQYEMKPIKTALAWKNSGGAMVALPKYLKRFPTLPDSVSWEDSLRRRGE